jgi:hypothetical protein
MTTVGIASQWRAAASKNSRLWGVVSPTCVHGGGRRRAHAQLAPAEHLLAATLFLCSLGRLCLAHEGVLLVWRAQCTAACVCRAAPTLFRKPRLHHCPCQQVSRSKSSGDGCLLQQLPPAHPSRVPRSLRAAAADSQYIGGCGPSTPCRAAAGHAQCKGRLTMHMHTTMRRHRDRH